jgi:transcriptional regulator with XRE-family HTH domain
LDKDIQKLCLNIGEKIRSARKKHEWTVAELAGRAGLSDKCVNRVEGGKTASKISTVYSLCIALGISSDKLLGLDQTGAGQASKAELDAAGLLGQLSAAELKYVTDLIKGLLEITRTH